MGQGVMLFAPTYASLREVDWPRQRSEQGQEEDSVTSERRPGVVRVSTADNRGGIYGRTIMELHGHGPRTKSDALI